MSSKWRQESEGQPLPQPVGAETEGSCFFPHHTVTVDMRWRWPVLMMDNGDRDEVTVVPLPSCCSLIKWRIVVQENLCLSWPNFYQLMRCRDCFAGRTFRMMWRHSTWRKSLQLIVCHNWWINVSKERVVTLPGGGGRAFCVCNHCDGENHGFCGLGVFWTINQSMIINHIQRHVKALYTITKKANDSSRAAWRHSSQDLCNKSWTI